MTAFTPQASRALGGPSWLADRRLAALAELDLGAPPSSDEEIWRYSRVDDLDPGAWAPSTAAGAAASPVASGTAPAGRVVVANGRVVDVELDHALASKGVVLGSLRAGVADERPDLREALGRASGDSPDWFTRLHDAYLADGVVLAVPAGVVVDRPVLVTSTFDGDGGASFPHVLVVLGEGAEATVAEHRSSSAARHLVSGVTELELGEGANLSYVALQDHGPAVWEVVLQRATLGRDATLRAAAAALGGDYARLRAETSLVGQGASAEQVAVYFGRNRQMLDFRTLSDHDAPRTSSDLLFKGAVDDESRSVYSGLIHLRPSAQKASAHQTNRNLVLAPPPAGAESIPNLEIEANDVRCSHASTIGPIDEDQRYYLESRGVPPAVAERLIVEGFFEDVLARLPVGPLGEPVRAAVTARFATGTGRG